ncbi:MAG: cytochrome b [Hydrogenophaga sp.]|jgi:cytochrome b561|uniref:cytochrome b n=1 Tax=Hydrogenophaga sp. TaxID=1904254 RepID=UPI0027268650|nr:cytochrome b [Hydrogenophaga sp.]MDO9480584.1 cytochrome b [Hydrogenophaga sp.]MDO9568761.1 cytochrome b [Hydrogenophaga sp.]MDP1895976.1 cytochrome b [Hydrogenophaga sp.]MDP2093273.1 cytochrome b [Hydrogenophaga sp.]MDP2219846.1 cytochrome b [Hydrogenophaga sp.]
MFEAPISRYHPVAVALHWLLGVALIAIFSLGLYMADLPFSPQRLRYYSWHKWAGVTVLVLSFVRLFWRLTHRPPALPVAIERAMPAWQRMAHHATHHGLYGLFFAVPLLGWAYSSAAGFPLVWFGVVPLPDFVPVSEALADVLKPLHKYSALAMAALVVLHVAGALKHQLVDRDGLLQRMGVGRN